MSTHDIIEQMKRQSEASFEAHVCGNCRHFGRDGVLSKCYAVGGRFASHIWAGDCNYGTLWEPRPIRNGLLQRLKRWLVG